MPLILLLACLVATPDGPVPVGEAAAKMTAPEGFRVTLFAGEPDLVQPIAFTFDDRGRLWAVENRSYPELKGKPEDVVSIFEDADNDGRFDKKTVFWSEGRNVSGIALGHGGVWLCSTPNLVFVPDLDGDDRPDGPPRVVLDGFDVRSRHNVMAALTWGPDGWLYGCHGIMATARVGKPGTPDAQRTPINCGVWRYHPTRGTFEVVMHGTTNPWGLDYDQYGQMFITNCVIEHAWQVIPGGQTRRMYGQPFNPHLYGLLDSPVDHVHWDTAENWDDIGTIGVSATTARAGGGHAHSGAMIFRGESWPPPYRGRLLTCNIHGARVNCDAIKPKGSGYVLMHANDLLHANDPWFRGVAILQGPDGNVFVADWSDTGECHDYEDIHRENGRIYKVTYLAKPREFRGGIGRYSVQADQAAVDRAKKPGDLARLADADLAALLTDPNEFKVRHARRLLAERAADGKLGPVDDSLREVFRNSREVGHRLNALWTLHARGRLDRDTLDRAFAADERPDAEHIRAWAVRLSVDDKAPDAAILARFVAMAKSDPSPVVRLALASALQRTPVADRWELAAALAAHDEDAADINLPLMIWYGIEPMVAADPTRALSLAEGAKIPLIRRHIARRYASLTP